MRSRLKSALSVYVCNPFFLTCACIYVVSAVGSKILYANRQSLFAEEVTTILFVVGLWLTFHMGIIVKRQFANYRASLLPGYRPVHLIGFFSLYVFFMMIAFAWEYNLMPLFLEPLQNKEGMYVIGIFVTLGITLMGYLSMLRGFIYLYMFLFIFAIFCMQAIDIIYQYPLIKYSIFALCVVLVYFFVQRLSMLKEDHYEYKYLISLSQKGSTQDQLKAAKSSSLKKSRSFTPYLREGNLWQRAHHWMQVDRDVQQARLWTVFLLIPLYLLYLKYARTSFDYFYASKSNLMLISVTPIILTISAYYGKMIYWGYDVLKPVTKNRFIQEVSAGIFLYHFKYWVIFSICFILAPALFLSRDEVFAENLWLYVLFTWIFSCFILTWLIYMMSFAHSRKVIGHGLILSLIVNLQFSYSESFSITILGVNSFICFLFTLILGRLAYRSWLQYEF